MKPSLQDKFNYLSKLTFRRLWNVFLIKSSFYISKFLKKNIHWGLPYNIGIEPTNFCNLKCPECLSGQRELSRDIGMIYMELFKKIVDEMYKDILYFTLHFLGEPYLHKELFSMIRYASDKKIYTFLSTNGHFLDNTNAKKTVESGLCSLTVSIDGTTQDIYSKYRKGGNLNVVIEGTKNIVKWKEELKSKTPYLIFQFIVFKFNEHQIDDMKVLAQAIGVNELQIKMAEIDISDKNAASLIPSNQKYSRYKKMADGNYTLSHEKKIPNHCYRMWHSCKITWDGMVIPCCFDKNLQHVLGNRNNASLKSIWKEKQYTNMCSQILKARNKIDICNTCLEEIKSEIQCRVTFP